MADVGVAVVGAGSWGTAFASISAAKGIDTVVWARREDLARAIDERHENPDYLAGLPLPDSLRATHDLGAAVGPAAVVVMAIPSHAFRATFREVAPHLGPNVPVVSLTKGIEQDTMLRMSQVLAEEGSLDPSRVAVLTGPNLAKEIVRGQPAATVVACVDESRARHLQEAFMSPTFRVYTNTDVIGCEIGGAMKNVIALAAGMADGMGFGDNAKASLMTRGLAELARLGVQMGGQPLTFSGLAGMGDLIATCMSKLSRNRHVGEELGRGRPLEEIQAEMHMVAEGVKSCRPLCQMAETHGVEVPIAEAVVGVVSGTLAPSDVLASLMSRQARPELHGIQ
jgi:glycerol-3-phosphate dehydrogenase (NAD(P)+)